MWRWCAGCGTGKCRGHKGLCPLFLEVGEDCPQDLEGHELALQGLVVHNLLELIQDGLVASGDGIRQEVVHRDAQAVHQPHQGVQGQAPLPALDGAHVGI